MTDKERKAHIKKSSGNYMRGRAMALSFKPLTLQDVKDAYECGAEEMESIIDNSMWWKSAEGEDLPDIDREVIAFDHRRKCCICPPSNGIMAAQ